MSKNYKKHYANLGLDPKEPLDFDVLKSAYKKVVREWHPDLNHHRIEEATEKFKEIVSSYEELIRILEVKGGEVKGAVMNAKEFFKHLGFDNLAEFTQDTLVEIDIERAANGLKYEGSGTAEMVDSKLMKKLKLWARGTDFDASVKVLDDEGHFTPKAILNILEWATIYENYESGSKKDFFSRLKVFLGAEDAPSEEDEESNRRLGSIIKEWVMANYIATSNLGYIHKSKYHYWLITTQNRLARGLAEIHWGKNSEKISSYIADGSWDKILPLLEEKMKDQDLSAALVASKKELAKAAKKEISKIDSELEAISKRLKVSVGELSAMLKEAELPPALEMMAPRIKELLEAKADSEYILAVGDSQLARDAQKINKLIGDVREFINVKKI